MSRQNTINAYRDALKEIRKTVEACGGSEEKPEDIEWNKAVTDVLKHVDHLENWIVDMNLAYLQGALDGFDSAEAAMRKAFTKGKNAS